MSRVQLSATERGRVLAALRLLGPIAAAARLRSPAARLYLEHLCDPAARRAEELALAATVPPYHARIDPSWYEPPPASTSPAAQRYLDRIAYGRLVAMEPPVERVTPRERGAPGLRAQAAVEQLLVGPVENLLAALLVLGRRRVAVAFTGAPRSALAQLLARIGEPEATHLATEVRSIPPGVSAEEVKAAQRALFRSGPEPQLGESGALFFRRVGCGWIAPLTDGDGDRARRLAQRLPRTLGEIILRERRRAQPEPGQPLGPTAYDDGAELAALLRLVATLPFPTTAV